MNCNQAQPLIPSYLDGELSEAQAGPLRKHLLDCQPCRGSAQGEKNLKRWFVAEEHVAIPRDFASRVARRAFAGDRGERHLEQPVGVIAARREEDPNLRFVLQMTSLAAAALIFLSLAIGSLKLPSGNKLQADSTSEVKLERAIDELNRLNAAESGPNAGRSDADQGVESRAAHGSVPSAPAEGNPNAGASSPIRPTTAPTTAPTTGPTTETGSRSK